MSLPLHRLCRHIFLNPGLRSGSDEQDRNGLHRQEGINSSLGCAAGLFSSPLTSLWLYLLSGESARSTAGRTRRRSRSGKTLIMWAATLGHLRKCWYFHLWKPLRKKKAKQAKNSMKGVWVLLRNSIEGQVLKELVYLSDPKNLAFYPKHTWIQWEGQIIVHRAVNLCVVTKFTSHNFVWLLEEDIFQSIKKALFQLSWYICTVCFQSVL